MSNKEGHLCVLCNNTLESKEALKEHFRKHANNEIDGKGNPRGVAFEKPVPSSSQNKPGVYVKGSASKCVDSDIICDVCGEAFKCNTIAIQHKFRKHPDSNMKHFCPQCGMQFPLKVHRDNHLDGHKIPINEIPEKKHSCYICKVEFYNEAAYDYHYKSVHKRIVSLYKPILTPPPSKKIRFNNAGEPQSVFYCHLCGIEYIVKFNLQKHLERQHTALERDGQQTDLFKCTTCEALFCNEKAYNNHNMYHKPDDLYVTSEEQRLQTVRRVDQDFDIRRVQTAVEKYVPIYRSRRITRPASSQINRKQVKKPKNSSDDELSPPSSYDSSSDDSDRENSTRKGSSSAKSNGTTNAVDS